MAAIGQLDQDLPPVAEIRMARDQALALELDERLGKLYSLRSRRTSCPSTMRSSLAVVTNVAVGVMV
jgi:hypothetical protein